MLFELLWNSEPVDYQFILYFQWICDWHLEVAQPNTNVFWSFLFWSSWTPGHDTHTLMQDLKDFARQSGLDVVYSEVSRDRDGRGYVCSTLQQELTAIDMSSMKH
jgi:hypothetical protein